MVSRLSQRVLSRPAVRLAFVWQHLQLGRSTVAGLQYSTQRERHDTVSVQARRATTTKRRRVQKVQAVVFDSDARARARLLDVRQYMDTDHAGTHAPDPEEAMDSSMAETGRDHERDKDDAQSLLKAITGDGPASSSPPPAPTPAEVANALKARAAELATTSTSTSTEKPKEDQKVVGFCFTCFNGFPGGRAFLMSLEIGVPILVVAGIVALIVCCTTSSSEGDDITESSSRSRSKNRAGHGTEEDNFNYAMSGQPGQQSIWRAGVRGAPQQQLQRSYSGGGRGRAGQKGAGSRAAADQWNAQFQQAASAPQRHARGGRAGNQMWG